jgi:hypothetical protein
MMYTTLGQRWPGKVTYYGQLEHIDTDTGHFTTLAKCQHRHRTMDGAEHCPDIVAVRNADLDRRLVECPK